MQGKEYLMNIQSYETQMEKLKKFVNSEEGQKEIGKMGKKALDGNVFDGQTLIERFWLHRIDLKQGVTAEEIGEIDIEMIEPPNRF